MFDEPIAPATQRYAKCIENSKRVRWDIDADVIRGRKFDAAHKFLPDGLSFAHEIEFLSPAEKRFVSQIQGRTYANMFGLVERFINAKVLEVSRDHWLGDQVALEALIRFSDEELKHQELFRRVDRLAEEAMPAGYCFMPKPNDVSHAVLAASTWAVLALTLHIELFTQVHYRESIDRDNELSPLFKDIFLYHWKEESQHAIMDELEFVRENEKITPEARDKAVDEFIALVGAVDGILQGQAKADTEYFFIANQRKLTADERRDLEAAFLRAYRWQYILSGASHPQFQKVLFDMITPAQKDRVVAAVSALA